MKKLIASIVFYGVIVGVIGLVLFGLVAVGAQRFGWWAATLSIGVGIVLGAIAYSLIYGLVCVMIWAQEEKDK